MSWRKLGKMITKSILDIRYINRPDNLREIPITDKVQIIATAVIDHVTDGTEVVTNETLLDIPNVVGTDTYKDVDICKDLPADNKKQLEQLVEEYQDIFTETPGTTFLAEHKINLISDEAIRIKQYPITYAMRDVVKEEIPKMLKADVIEKSDSPFSTPVVLVRKPDGSARFCLDFRATNKRTVFDAEPMPLPEDIFAKLRGDKYYSKIDICKGFSQIPMSQRDKHKTAFCTPQGHFQLKKCHLDLLMQQLHSTE